MSATWAVIGAVGLATIAIKAAGPVILGGRELPARFATVLRMLAPAMLAALVATQVLVTQRTLALDERAMGLLVAFVALLFRAPTLVVVVLAAATTALARSLR